MGHEGIVYKTENGGESWTEQQSGTKNALFDLSVTGPQSVWAIGDVSSILHTTDGGNTWTAQQKSDGTPGLELSSIGVREDMTLAISDPIFYGVSCVDDNTCFVVGEFGQIRMTTDGGKTWGAGHGGLLGGKTIYRDVMSMPTFLCVRARDAQHAVAVGTYGAIASTSDGVNWTWNQTPGNAPLYDIRVLPDGDYLDRRRQRRAAARQPGERLEAGRGTGGRVHLDLGVRLRRGGARCGGGWPWPGADHQRLRQEMGVEGQWLTTKSSSSIRKRPRSIVSGSG